MSGPVPLVELWRGDFLESVHTGHAVICTANGEVVESWGNPEQVILPRSSCKMVQALPLVTSGAADAAGLTDEQLALSCASHNGADIHVSRVNRWLADLGLDEKALICGPQAPDNAAEHKRLLFGGDAPGRSHNNCSGKHSGFLTLARHLGAGPDYVDPDHPVQQAVRAAFEDATGTPDLGHAIDGCSAPNYATTVAGLARAVASFASSGGGTLGAAKTRLISAMMTYPELVGGEDKADTLLMRTLAGKAAIKTGAEGVYVGILPDLGLGFALKITDGTTRASECVATALLIRLGVLDPRHPVARRFVDAPILNRRNDVTGYMRAVGLS